MAEWVAPDLIEKIVGAKRRKHAHLARVVSAEETVYVLHSKWCVAHNPDLMRCSFSRALDRGIPMDLWEYHLDMPVKVNLRLVGDYLPQLVPDEEVVSTPSRRELVKKLRNLADVWDARADHNDGPGRGDYWRGKAAKSRECADELRRALRGASGVR